MIQVIDFENMNAVLLGIKSYYQKPNILISKPNILISKTAAFC